MGLRSAVHPLKMSNPDYCREGMGFVGCDFFGAGMPSNRPSDEL